MKYFVDNTILLHLVNLSFTQGCSYNMLTIGKACKERSKSANLQKKKNFPELVKRFKYMCR